MQYIREKIHLLHKRRASGKVENSTGFLIEAIRQNYANPDYALGYKARQLLRPATPGGSAKGRGGVWKRKVDLERARDKELQALCRRIAEASPDVLEAALPELLADRFFGADYYKRSKSALENLRERPLLEMAFYPTCDAIDLSHSRLSSRTTQRKSRP